LSSYLSFVRDDRKAVKALGRDMCQYVNPNLIYVLINTDNNARQVSGTHVRRYPRQSVFNGYD
jgi:hypothetical protein